jgi:hypothetical protein
MPTPTGDILDAGTGATGTFVVANAPVINKQLATKAIPVQVATGTVIYSTHTAELPIPSLPRATRLCHTLPDLTHLLVSVRQLCDAGCLAVFDKNAIVITLNNTVLMLGKRHHVSRLWHLTIPPPGFPPTIQPSPHIAARQKFPITTAAFANVAHLSVSPAELVTFVHTALFSPSLSTLCTALDLKHVTGFPGLTSKLVRKPPPQSIATAMGHMDNRKKNSARPNPKKIHHPRMKRPPTPFLNHHRSENAPIMSTLQSPTPVKQEKCFLTKWDASSYPRVPTVPNSSSYMITLIIPLSSQ